MNKTAMITGATSGLGAAFAKKLAQLGYDLILTGRRTELLQILADDLIQGHNIQVKVVSADLSQTEDVSRLCDILSAQDRVDMLINNAGYGLYHVFAEVEVRDCEKMIQVHEVAPLKFISAVLPKMIAQGQGAIINVSSLGGICPIKKDAVYCGTKSFLRTFTESLHMEVKDLGIKVQALCPGFTKTHFHDQLPIASGEMNRLKSLWMSPESVVNYSLKCLSRSKVICVPGWKNRLLIAVAAFLPRSMYYKLVGS